MVKVRKMGVNVVTNGCKVPVSLQAPPGSSAATNQWNDSTATEAAMAASGQKPRPDRFIGMSTLLSDVGVNGVVRHCPWMASLDLNECRITNASLVFVGRYCKQLRSLNISGCTGVGDQGLSAITTSCTSLRKLHLARCPMLSEKSLGQICFLRELRELSLDDNIVVNDATLEGIIHSCPLVYLSVHNCTLISDQSISYLSEPVASELRYIDVGNTDVRGKAIFAIALTCHNLTYLNCTNCSDVDGVTIQEMAYGLPRIQQVIMQGCTQITGASLVNFAAHATRLRAFNAGNCEDVTDKAVLALGDHCTHLSHVNLQGCLKITDWSVKHLLRRCTNIVNLILCGSTGITDDTLLYAGTLTLPAFAKLDVRLCGKVSFSAERYLSRRMPRLIIIRKQPTFSTL